MTDLPILTAGETWLPVIGFETSYEVSNLGRVRSKDRSYIQKSRSGKLHTHTRKGQVLKPGLSSNGYPSVVLGRGNTRMVHRLVAEAFLGPCPEGKETCHKDGDRTNTNVDNLYWGSRSDNLEDMWEHGSRVKNLGWPFKNV